MTMGKRGTDREKLSTFLDDPNYFLPSKNLGPLIVLNDPLQSMYKKKPCTVLPCSAQTAKKKVRWAGMSLGE